MNNLESCIKKVNDDSIVFGNVPIYGPDGELVRTYSEVHFDRDVQRDPNGNLIQRSFPGFIRSFKEEGKVLPSLDLTLSCLSIALDHRTDDQVHAFLADYGSVLGDEYTAQLQNTVFRGNDNGRVDIIHFPNYLVCDEQQQDVVSTQSSRVYNGFNLGSFYEKGGDYIHIKISEETIMQNPEFARFLRGATGLKDLQRLINLGSYLNSMMGITTFAMTGCLLLGNYMADCLLGCDTDSFSLVAGLNFSFRENYNWCNARGIRLVQTPEQK